MDGHKSNDPSASRGPSARNEGAIGRSKARAASRVTWGIALLPVVILIVLYPQMPDRVPVHYNAAGIADRYADKFSFDLLLFALLGFVGPLLMKPLGYFVVRSQGAGEDTGGSSLPFYMNVVAALVTLLFTAMSAYSMVRMADPDVFGSISLTRVIAVLLGAILMYVGNAMPKLKRNGLSGFRTRSTLMDDDIWFKTQRVAGKVWTAGGFLTMLAAFAPGSLLVPLAVGIITLSVLIPLAYSRWIVR